VNASKAISSANKVIVIANKAHTRTFMDKLGFFSNIIRTKVTTIARTLKRNLLALTRNLPLDVKPFIGLNFKNFTMPASRSRQTDQVVRFADSLKAKNRNH